MAQNVENLNTYTYALLIKLQNRKNTKCSKHVWFHWYLQFSMISSSFQVHNFVRVFICWMKMKFMSCIISRDFCDAKNAKCKNERDFPDKQMFDKIRGIFSCLLHSMRTGLPNALPNAYHLSLRTLENTMKCKAIWNAKHYEMQSNMKCKAKCARFLISDQLLKKENAPTSCGSNPKTIEECGTFPECLTCKTAKIEDRDTAVLRCTA